MSSPAGRVALVFLPCVSACAAPSASGTQDWLGRVYADHGDLTLGDVLLPGTHDSASYGAAAENGLSPHSGDLLVGLWDLPGAEEPGGSRERVVGWARTQDRTLREQLDDGIRYLDVRVTVRDGELLTWHSVYSVPLSTALDDVVAFSVAHPRELVVVQFGLDLQAQDYPDFGDALTRPRADGVSFCDRLIDEDAAAATLSLDTLWTSERSLVWGADGELRTWLRDHTSCPTSKVPIEGHWSLATTPEVVADVLADTVDAHQGDSLLSNDFIFSLEGTSDRLAQLDFVSSYPTLMAAEEALGFSGDLPGRLIETYNVNGNMGVFAGDHYEATDLVSSAIAANQAEVDAR